MNRCEAEAMAREPGWREALLELWLSLRQERAGTPELIGWAVEALAAGVDGPALRRLAGLYAHQPLSDAAPWLDKTLQELGQRMPEGDGLLDANCELLARRILSGEQEPIAGLARLSRLIYARRTHDPLLQPLCDLQAAAELQADELGSYTWLYPEFETRPLRELILEECRLLQALHPRYASPEAAAALMATSWCLACGARGVPVLRPAPERFFARIWRLLSENPRPRHSHCQACGSRELLPLTSLAGRLKLLPEAPL